MSWTPPGIFNPSVGVITPWSPESIGAALMSTGTTGAPAVAGWPSANRAIYIPFELASAVTVTAGIYYSNSATGNYDIGVYKADGTKVVTKGSTALATGWQVADVTDTLVQPGRYYMAFVLSSTQSFYSVAPAVAIGASMGAKQQSSALPLPSIATFADLASAYIPAFGLQLSTVNL